MILWSMLIGIRSRLISEFLDCSELSVHENKKDAIEKILHKYELEIRAHIKIEAEYKKIAKEAEDKLAKMKEETAAFNEKYDNLVIQLSNFAYKNESLTRENQKLKRDFFQLNKKEEKKSLKKAYKSYKSSDNQILAHFNPHSYCIPSKAKKRVGLKESLEE